MTNQNGFDDFDTQVTAEEFYGAEQDYYRELADDQQADWADLASVDTSGSYSYEEPDYPHDLDGYDHPEFDG
jgi:hypothetical protein